MNFDEVTLIEIEDCIQALDESVGLKVETIQDIAQAISKQRGLVKKLTIHDVVGQSEQFKCHSCGTNHSGKNDDQLYEVCKDCFDGI